MHMRVLLLRCSSWIQQYSFLMMGVKSHTTELKWHSKHHTVATLKVLFKFVFSLLLSCSSQASWTLLSESNFLQGSHLSWSLYVLAYYYILKVLCDGRNTETTTESFERHNFWHLKLTAQDKSVHLARKNPRGIQNLCKCEALYVGTVTLTDVPWARWQRMCKDNLHVSGRISTYVMHVKPNW